MGFRRHFGDEERIMRQSLSNNHIVQSSLSPMDHGLSLIKSKYQLVKYISVIYVELHFILTLMQTELCHA